MTLKDFKESGNSTETGIHFKGNAELGGNTELGSQCKM